MNCQFFLDYLCLFPSNFCALTCRLFTKKLSLTNSNHAPYLAIIIPGIIGFLLSLSGEGDLLILMAVFGATISYVLMMMSYIKLKLSRPNLARPYKAPGGIVTASIALILAAIAVVAGFLVDFKVWLWQLPFTWH